MGLPLTHLTRLESDSGPPTAPWPVAAGDTLRIEHPPARRRLARWTGAGLAVTLGLGAAALAGPVTLPGTLDRFLGGGTASASSPASDTRGQVASLLTRLETALRTGDAAAIAALVDPANPALRERWTALPARARAVGATTLRLGLAPGQLPAVRTTGLTAGYDRMIEIPVQFGYTLAGWDRGPVTTVIALRLARSASTWRLVDDSGLAAAVPSAGPLEPWVAGSVDVVITPTVMVIGDPGRHRDNQRLATTLVEAVRDVRSAVPVQGWNGKVVAYASTRPEIVASWFGGRAASEGRRAGADPAAFAAEVRTLAGQVPTTTRGGEAGPMAADRPAASRMAVTPFLLSRTDARARAVLRHEVTHVALTLDGEGQVPAWLVEGTAEYVAYRSVENGHVSGLGALDRRGLPTATWTQLRKRVWKPQLVADSAAFYTGTNAQVARHYTDAWLTCLYIAARHGENTLFQLYRAAASAPAGASSATTEADALRAVLGMDQAELRRQAAAYARTLRTNFS